MSTLELGIGTSLSLFLYDTLFKLKIKSMETHLVFLSLSHFSFRNSDLYQYLTDINQHLLFYIESERTPNDRVPYACLYPRAHLLHFT